MTQSYPLKTLAYCQIHSGKDGPAFEEVFLVVQQQLEGYVPTSSVVHTGHRQNPSSGKVRKGLGWDRASLGQG